MKAITLWQPYASLIACGAKPYETRGWAPPRNLIGETIAIHAAKKIDRELAGFAEELVYGQHEDGGFDLAEKLTATWSRCSDSVMGTFGEAVMPIGCVVAIARLDAAFQLGEPAEGTEAPAAVVAQRMLSRPTSDLYAVKYDDFGDYAPGRWAWLLRDVQVINPCIPIKGAQGFFDLPQGWLTEKVA